MRGVFLGPRCVTIRAMQDPGELRPPVIGVEDMGFHYPKCETLFDHLSFGITQSSRCVIDACLPFRSPAHHLPGGQHKPCRPLIGFVCCLRVCVVGPNGAGKSTLLNLIMGNLQAGAPPTMNPKTALRIAHVSLRIFCSLNMSFGAPLYL